MSMIWRCNTHPGEREGYQRRPGARDIRGLLLAAYKRKFGTSDNAVVEFNEAMTMNSSLPRK